MPRGVVGFQREVTEDEIQTTPTRMPCTRPEIVRLLSRTERPLDDTVNCNMWLGHTRHTDKKGSQHGMITWRGKMVYAHRLFYTLLVGDIPDGAHVRHSCPEDSNGKCINPRHLIVGDHFDNMGDASRAGTMAKKLTWEKAREIRCRRDEPRAALAAEFGVTADQIANILAGRQWREQIN